MARWPTHRSLSICPPRGTSWCAARSLAATSSSTCDGAWPDVDADSRARGPTDGLGYPREVSVDPLGAPNAWAASAAGLDETSKDWVDGLLATGSQHEACIVALHALLLRVARHEVARRAGSLQLRGPELEDIAQQATDDALMAIRAKVPDFRGESRFTTWAYRFVMFEVSTKMGRHFWRARRTTMDDDAWERLPDTRAQSPHQQSEQREVRAALRRAIDEDLTPRQRRVFVAIALNEVPMDAFARELGASRNTVYKALFDARRKLKASLSAAGYERPAHHRGTP
jgi:RNA polymerase sigma-70 factor, ECF subfamily